MGKVLWENRLGSATCGCPVAITDFVGGGGGEGGFKVEDLGIAQGGQLQLRLSYRVENRS